MLWKKTILAVAAAALSAPALADRGYRDHGRYPYAKHYEVRRHVVQERYYYHPRPAPQRVVVVHHRPQPVYVQSAHPHPGAAILVGAVLGAVIGHHIAYGY